MSKTGQNLMNLAQFYVAQDQEYTNIMEFDDF